MKQVEENKIVVITKKSEKFSGKFILISCKYTGTGTAQTAVEYSISHLPMEDTTKF